MNKTLKAMLADTPLVKNLDNEEYLSIILDGCSTLEERFARIDSNIVVEELKKAEKRSKGCMNSTDTYTCTVEWME